MKTMTLEGLLQKVEKSERVTGIIDTLRAAIRERDRLRRDVADMTEELLHVPSRKEWGELQKRAEKAEAELAAIKSATCAWTHDLGEDTWDSVCGERWMFDDGGPRENNVRFCHGCGKRVRLLVEDDDEH